MPFRIPTSRSPSAVNRSCSPNPPSAVRSSSAWEGLTVTTTFEWAIPPLSAFIRPYHSNTSELYSSAGRPNAPIVSGGKCPWNPALCTDITTASRRWNGSLANAVRRYTGAKAVCQSCACSTCVSGAIERRRGLAHDLVQRHENGGRQACGGLTGRQTAHGLAQPTGAGEGPVLGRQVGDTDALIRSDLGPRRRGGRRPARLGGAPPPGLRGWGGCRAHVRLHWLAHSGRRRIVRRLLPPHRGEVILRDIIPDHALGGEPRARGAQRVPHLLRPAARDTLDIPLVEQRHDLVFEQAVQLRGVGRIGVLTRRRWRNGPAVRPIVTLSPPPVQRAQLGHAVQGRLHAARTARLERGARHVEPQVHALDQAVGQMHVVVLEERNPALEPGFPSVRVHALQHLLARLVTRMRLAGEHDLHWSPGVQ